MGTDLVPAPPAEDPEQLPISDLFSKDPTIITNQEMARMVEFFRGERKRLLISDAEGTKAKPKRAKPTQKLSLNDLDL